MKVKNPKILILATSHKTRGGITSVVKAHQTGVQWEQHRCKWIETHIDKGTIYKLFFLIKGFIAYCFYLPFYHLVHIHTSEPPSAIRKIPFQFLAKLLGKKTIIHFHAFSSKTTIYSKYRRVYQYLFNKSDCVIVLSEYWKKELENTFQLKDKTKILYNPCSEPNYSIRHKKQRQILYAGTVNARKGYSDLIKAFALIANNFPDWKIVFAGNGEIEQGKALAHELNIQDQTIFLGWVNGNEKAKAFQETSIFCLPSYAEGFPMAVLDAWAYGLPVITTPVGGLPDVLEEDKNALIFEPGNIQQLAQQLQRIIEDTTLRESIEKESVSLATNIFNRTVICKQLDDIYNNILHA
jgi:glycosyltransferase involved in cell wall biosynthesis